MNNIASAFLETATPRADKPALFWGDSRFTYGHYRDQVLGTAAMLRARGIRPADRVAVWLKNCPEFVGAMFGVLAADAVLVPINNFLKPAEVAYMLQDAGIDWIIAEEGHAGLPELRTLRPGLQVLAAEALPTAPAEIAAPSRGRDDLAVLIYTSGTTGHPKGAMLSHRNLLENVASCRTFLELSEDDRLVVLLPMFHSFMLTVGLLLPLLSGASVVAVQGLHSPKQMIAEILQNRGTLLPAMAALFRALSQIPAGIEFTSLRLCVSGAGPLPMEILHGFQSRHPKVPLIEGYGLSEASPVVTVNPPRAPKAGTIGIPIPGVEVTVQDDQGNHLPDGVDGEICVRGGNVMLGYWNAPEKTAETLRGGWLLTGDIGHRRPDGWFVITDRKKDMLKPNGMNVYPREIEEVIYRFPGIREAAVVGEPCERRGERAIAFVSMDEGKGFDEHALIAFLKENLADYKVPRRAIELAALPRNATGKILKTALREKLAHGH
jgi:long-chain acyl-CoA synthetase